MLTGFQRDPSIAGAQGTALHHLSMAFAVKAIIGVRHPISLSLSRIFFVAESPSISGICTSMRIASKLWLKDNSTASFPLAATKEGVPFSPTAV
jgi:hypothetical protein